MSLLSALAGLANLESMSDYKVKNPHQGWAVLSMFGPTSETGVAEFWKFQKGCEEGETIERFVTRYQGRVELARGVTLAQPKPLVPCDGLAASRLMANDRGGIQSSLQWFAGRR